MRISSFCCFSDSFGCLPRSLPLARAMAIPSRVRILIRSASNFGEGGQNVEEHFAHRIGRIVDRRTQGELDALFRELPAIARASGTDRARRSSFGTISTSPSRTAASAWSRPGRARDWCLSARGRYRYCLLRPPELSGPRRCAVSQSPSRRPRQLTQPLGAHLAARLGPSCSRGVQMAEKGLA